MTRLLRLSALALLVRCAGAQQPQTRDDDGPLHCSEHYKSRFRDWITEYGVEFKTETEFQARLETFVKNRCVLYSTVLYSTVEFRCVGEAWGDDAR